MEKLFSAARTEAIWADFLLLNIRLLVLWYCKSIKRQRSALKKINTIAPVKLQANEEIHYEIF